MSVEDDGVGMPTGNQAKAGLGTGIIEALAKPDATIQVQRLDRGVAITISQDRELDGQRDAPAAA